YHAVSIALRFPDKFNRCVGMSGPYDFAQMSGPYSVFNWVFDYYDETVNVCNPVPFVASISNEDHLKKIREMDIIFASGTTDPLFDGNQQLSHVLWEKDIWHAFRIWDGFAHDWPVWHDMVKHYIGGPDSGEY
ncbi:MAG: hypothetical protein K8F91_22035, partial [Candidatus Obscuribacterales bacterium]|nr:hypothetical protein [Candidatus Obscuribacterales bacterium]